MSSTCVTVDVHNGVADLNIVSGSLIYNSWSVDWIPSRIHFLGMSILDRLKSSPLYPERRAPFWKFVNIKML